MTVMSNDQTVIDYCKELVKTIQFLGQRYSVWQVFEDFLAMSAISISNAVDWNNRDERENQYLSTVKRYPKKDLEIFPKMLAYLVESLESYADQPYDVLGSIFHELELHNKYRGQFFTPQHICDFMGMVTMSENDPDISKRGFISLCEPCAGSGAMILGFAKAIKKSGYEFQRHMVVTATDIDPKCVFMTYLQLSLYGIPAIVIHGDSLAMKEWSKWYTPAYMLGGWAWKQNYTNLSENSTNETPKIAIEMVETEFDIKLSESKNGQFTFNF